MKTQVLTETAQADQRGPSTTASWGLMSLNHTLQTRKLRMARQSITLDYSRRNWLFERSQGLRLRDCEITRYHRLISLIWLAQGTKPDERFCRLTN